MNTNETRVQELRIRLYARISYEILKNKNMLLGMNEMCLRVMAMTFIVNATLIEIEISSFLLLTAQSLSFYISFYF